MGHAEFWQFDHVQSRHPGAVAWSRFDGRHHAAHPIEMGRQDPLDCTGMSITPGLAGISLPLVVLDFDPVGGDDGFHERHQAAKGY